MANRRCIQTLISRYFSPTHSPNTFIYAVSKTLNPQFLQAQLDKPQNVTLTEPPISISPKFCSPFSLFSQHFCSGNRINNENNDDDGDDDDDDDDDDGEDDDEEESEAEACEDEDEDDERGNASGKSDEEKAKEAEEIGYKVVGPLQKSDKVFKPYEAVFAVVQIGSHQFKVSNRDSIFVEKLKYCDVNDKLILNRVLMVGSMAQTIIGRPILPDAAVHAVVEEHALDAKVIIFKKKRRKNYRRTRGHRQELTKLRITDIQGIEKPESIPTLKTEMKAAKKLEKTAVSA